MRIPPKIEMDIKRPFRLAFGRAASKARLEPDDIILGTVDEPPHEYCKNPQNALPVIEQLVGFLGAEFEDIEKIYLIGGRTTRLDGEPTEDPICGRDFDIVVVSQKLSEALRRRENPRLPFFEDGVHEPTETYVAHTADGQRHVTGLCGSIILMGHESEDFEFANVDLFVIGSSDNSLSFEGIFTFKPNIPPLFMHAIEVVFKDGPVRFGQFAAHRNAGDHIHKKVMVFSEDYPTISQALMALKKGLEIQTPDGSVFGRAEISEALGPAYIGGFHGNRGSSVFGSWISDHMHAKSKSTIGEGYRRVRDRYFASSGSDATLPPLPEFLEERGYSSFMSEHEVSLYEKYADPDVLRRLTGYALALRDEIRAYHG